MSNDTEKIEFVKSRGLAEPNEDKRRERIRANLEKLAGMKEENKIDRVDYEPDYLYYLCSYGEPLTQKDLQRYAQNSGGQAVNITQEELFILKVTTGNNLKLILKDGSIVEIDPGRTGYAKDDRLVIFPEELGN